MLPIRQHLGENLDRARELLLGHWSDPGRSDLENQGVAGIAGSESDPLSFPRRRQRSPPRRVSFHTQIISIQTCPTHLEAATITT
jgi:hypothetical protein